MLPLLAAALPGIIGGAANQVMGGINQRSMLRYNSPKQQLRRLRDAGLPYAAYGANAGNQTAPTQSNDLGLGQTAQNIGQYSNVKKQQEEINKILEDVKREKLLNEKLGAELAWYRAGAGSDPSRTNLTSMLGLEQQIKGGMNVGQQIGNQTAWNSLQNQPLKISLDNQEQRQRISNMIQTNTLGGEQIEGVKLDNALKSIDTLTRRQLNAANLDNVLKRNGILLTEQGIKQLQKNMMEDTYDNDLTASNMAAATARMGYDILGANFRQSKAWQEMVAESQKLFNMNKGQGGTLGEAMKSLGAFAYTLFGNNQGSLQMPNLPTINTGNKNFTNHHWHNGE